MPERTQVKLTCVVKSCFAFGELIKEGATRIQTALLIPEDEMINGENPKRYSGMVPGYRNVPRNMFRIEEVAMSDGGPVTIKDSKLPETSIAGVDLTNKIIQALDALDPDDPTHWTSTGDPRMDIVIENVGEQVTRNEVELAYPGFTRPPNDG